MTRTNFTLLWIVTVLSLLCYQRVERDPYGPYFVEGLDLIQRHWYRQVKKDKVHQQQLFDAAMQAVAGELDKHSNFITREKTPFYLGELNQHFSGIGIQVFEKTVDGEIRIIVANTVIGTPRPAHDVGLRTGDRIVKIDGDSVIKKRLQDAVKQIKGNAGEPVQITVTREGHDGPLELTVIRSDILVDSVLGDLRDAEGNWVFQLEADPRITYIRLGSFGERTVKELRAALAKAKKDGEIEALVVDVRDNDGGYLQAAVDVGDLFVAKGVIVSTRGGEEPRVYEAKASGTHGGFPMVVLINGQSASASEIFAACLQDYRRAVAVGSRSYGKGSVQQMFSMEGGRSILKLTTSTYWRPSEKRIHKPEGAEDKDEWGVRPNQGFKVVLDEEQEKKRRENRRDRDAFRPQRVAPPDPSKIDLDPQLRRAVEYLQSKLKSDSA